MPRTTRDGRATLVFLTAVVVLLGALALVAFGGNSTAPAATPAKPADLDALTIYVQNFDPAYVRGSVIRDDIPVWERAANGAFRRTWHTPKLHLVFVPRGKHVPRGAEVLQITANGPVDGAAAYHTQNAGRSAIVVYAGIDDAYGISLSVAATHEIFERLGDGTTANINQGWPVDYFTVSHGQFETPDYVQVPVGQLMINEVCDPVEAFHYVLKSKTGKAVWISDWVTPNYFNDHAETPDGVPQFDYLGLVQSPLEVLPGGYQALFVIDFQIIDPFGHPYLYTGWISLTNFARKADKAWLAGEHGKVIPFGNLKHRRSR